MIYNNSVAILYQKQMPPRVDGICKPMKPGGYRDSSADIAFALSSAGVDVVTPVAEPNPQDDLHWTFPDTSEGIKMAIVKGARTIWANTVLYKNHPIEELSSQVKIVGQSSRISEEFDDKSFTNNFLLSNGCPTAKSIIVGNSRQFDISTNNLSKSFLNDRHFMFPLIIKPVRGRGSVGVSKVNSFSDLKRIVQEALDVTTDTTSKARMDYGNALMIEEFLPGIEVTVTVMPPGLYEKNKKKSRIPKHWALTPVKRFNHQNEIAPYNGAVAVTQNSCLLDAAKMKMSKYIKLLHYCERAASLIHAVAPIRIDCRESENGDFKLFDVNIKPNMTGAGRPGREQQDSLSCIAARAIHWSYSDLLMNMLNQAW